MAREKQINFRVSEEEAARFDRVASHYGIALAAMLRMLVKEKYDALTRAARRKPISEFAARVRHDLARQGERR
jgi:antitoxin component of RelBE/YafQ-DinJ toxin-antitoxin module